MQVGCGEEDIFGVGFTGHGTREEGFGDLFKYYSNQIIFNIYLK
jgi:hypothetical protein